MRLLNIHKIGAIAFILGICMMTLGCSPEAADESGTSDHAEVSVTEHATDDSGNSEALIAENPSEETVQTEITIDNEAEPFQLTRQMIPAVTGLPEPRTMDEVAEALIKFMSVNHPNMKVSKIDLIGNGSTDYSDANAVNSFWCSYLLKSERKETVGVEIVCSKYMLPCVTELDMIRATDGNVYDVINNVYLAQEEAQKKSVEHQTNDPFAPNPDGSIRRPTVVEVPDYQGNMRKIEFTDDLG